MMFRQFVPRNFLCNDGHDRDQTDIGIVKGGSNRTVKLNEFDVSNLIRSQFLLFLIAVSLNHFQMIISHQFSPQILSIQHLEKYQHFENVQVTSLTMSASVNTEETQ